MHIPRTFGILVTTLLAASAAAAEKPAAPFDTAGIEELTGAKGAYDEKEGVFKVSLAARRHQRDRRRRADDAAAGSDLVGGVHRAGKHTMVMGDMVLLEDQVNPVMSVALDNGLEVTALHNHFFWDTPEGDVHAHRRHGRRGKLLAGAVGKVFAQIKETSGGKGEVPTRRHRPGEDDAVAREDRRGPRRTRASSRTASTRW